MRRRANVGLCLLWAVMVVMGLFIGGRTGLVFVAVVSLFIFLTAIGLNYADET